METKLLHLEEKRGEEQRMLVSSKRTGQRMGPGKKKDVCEEYVGIGNTYRGRGRAVAGRR